MSGKKFKGKFNPDRAKQIFQGYFDYLNSRPRSSSESSSSTSSSTESSSSIVVDPTKIEGEMSDYVSTNIDRLRLSSSSSSNSDAMNPFARNILVPTEKMAERMGETCIYCNIEDGFSFSGKFKNCLRHGGERDSDLPCFHCVIESNGELNRFKLCEFHKEGAEVPYKIITLRNMTKVVKIENTPENESKISQISKNRPIQTKGYSLGSARKVIIASYEKFTPPNLPILNNLEIECSEIKNETPENIANIENFESKITENSDEYFHKKLDMSRKCSRLLEPENQYVDCDVNDLCLQSFSPGIVANPMTSYHDPNEMEPGERLLVMEPNLEQAAAVLGKNKKKLSLESYKKLTNPTKYVLDEHIDKLANDKVWNSWHDALKLLFEQKGVEDPEGLIDMIVTMIKINCNVYMHGSEFLVKYQGAKHEEEQLRMIQMQKEVLLKFQKAMESSVRETLSHKDVLSYLANELKEYKALPDDDDEMGNEAGPPRKKVRQEDEIAIPYGDSARVYSRAECKEMIDLFEKTKAMRSAPTPTLLTAAAAVEPVRTLFTIGAPGPSGSGRGAGRGGRRGGYAQQRMDNKRQENLRGAAGAKFTIEQVINLGKTSTCPEDAKVMAEKARRVLQKKVENVLVSKAKLVYNEELRTHVPPTTADIPVGQTTVPDTILKVWDKPKNGEEGWVTVQEMKERLTAQFGKHLWYE